MGEDENNQEKSFESSTNDNIDNNLNSTNEENDFKKEKTIPKIKDKVIGRFKSINNSITTKLLLSLLLVSTVCLNAVCIIGFNDYKTISEANYKTISEAISYTPKWEYKVVYIEATETFTYLEYEQNPSNIELTDDMINEYGLNGWELADSYLEMETVYPNFGNSQYVTGIQPNVRPQRLVLIFKKELK
ncbi:MAG: DUF4177 domain-containing protein [Clostridium celatum]|nr:DUF4177 domain-containing protein [Clostridium celatum]